jgi:phosphatidylglycerol lysyltransferase
MRLHQTITGKTMFERIRKWNLRRFSPLIGMLLFCAALVALHRSASTLRIHDVLSFIKALPYARVWAAVALVVVNFFLFTGYDLLALRYIGRRLPLRKVAGTAMLGFSFSNVVGGTMLGGGGIRYRAYESAKLSASEILRISLFIWMSWIVGVATLNGVVACAFPHMLDALQWQHVPDLRWFGVPLCLVVAGYLVVTAKGCRPLTLFGIQWPLPKLQLALSQIGVVVADLLLSALILYLLLPDQTTVAFPAFAAVFIVAITLSLYSGIPGGLGVFEVLMLHLLKGTITAPEILGSLVVFRVIYYLIPLTIGATVLGATEAYRWIRPFKPVGRIAVDWVTATVPQVFSAAVLLAGGAMLVTGTLPMDHEQLQWLRHALPLGLFEMSHFLSSVVGLMLILLSRELLRRQRGA